MTSYINIQHHTETYIIMTSYLNLHHPWTYIIYSRWWVAISRTSLSYRSSWLWLWHVTDHVTVTCDRQCAPQIFYLDRLQHRHTLCRKSQPLMRPCISGTAALASMWIQVICLVSVTLFFRTLPARSEFRLWKHGQCLVEICCRISALFLRESDSWE